MNNLNTSSTNGGSGGSSVLHELTPLFIHPCQHLRFFFQVMPSRPTRDDCFENPEAAQIYLQNIETLTSDLPATYLVVAGERRSVMTTAI